MRDGEGSPTFGSQSCGLVAAFLLMPHCEDRDITCIFKVIERDISAIAERYHPLTKSCFHSFDGTAKARLRTKRFDLHANGCNGTARGIQVF